MGVHRSYSRHNNFAARTIGGNLVEFSLPLVHINLQLRPWKICKKSFEPVSTKAQETAPSPGA